MLNAAASLFSRAVSTVTNYGTSDTQKTEKKPLLGADRKTQNAARQSLKAPLEAQPPVKEEKTSETKQRTFAPKHSATTKRMVRIGKQRMVHTNGTIPLRDVEKDKEFKNNKEIGEKDKYEFHKDKEGNTLFKTEKGYVKLKDEQTGKTVHRDREFITNSTGKEIKELQTGDSAQESFENKANMLAHADRTAMEKLSSRFSKFTLAIKQLGTDLVYAPLRLLNIPVQFTMAAILASQSLYRLINPSESGTAYTAKQLSIKSKTSIVQGFVSAGAAVVPLLGSTIGLVTAPTFNTKHFTGSLGVRATKLLGVFTAAILQKETAMKADSTLGFIADVVGRANHPQTIHEGLKNKQTDTNERVTFSDKVKSLFMGKGKLHDKPVTLTERAEDEIYRGGRFNHLARTFNAMALHSFKEIGLSLTYGMNPDGPASESYAKMKTKVVNKGKHTFSAMSGKDRTEKQKDLMRPAGVSKEKERAMSEQNKKAVEISQQDK